MYVFRFYFKKINTLKLIFLISILSYFLKILLKINSTQIININISLVILISVYNMYVYIHLYLNCLLKYMFETVK